MALKLNGKPFDPTASPRLELALKLLNSLPPDELLDIGELAKRIGLSRSHAHIAVSKHELIRPFRCRIGVRNYFGSKAAIAELKRRIGDKA